VTLRLERDQLREQLQRQAAKVVAAAEQEDQLRAVISQLESTKRERDMYAWRLLGEHGERGTADRPAQLAPLPPAQDVAERIHALAEELAEEMAAEMGRKFAEEAANSHRTIESLTMALAATKSQVLYLREQQTGQRDSLAWEEREAELVAEKERLSRQAKELAKQLALRIKERDERTAELGATVENLAAVTAEREQLTRQLEGAAAETAAARSALAEARAMVPTVPMVSEEEYARRGGELQALHEALERLRMESYSTADELQAAKQAAEAERAAKQAERVSRRDEAAAAAATAQAAATALEEERASVAAAKAEHEATAARLEEAQAAIAQARAAQAAAEEQQMSTRMSHERALAAASYATAEVRARLEHVTAERDLLADQLATLREVHETAHTKNDALGIQLARLRAEEETLTSKLAVVKEMHEATALQRAGLAETLAKVEAERNALAAQADSARRAASSERAEKEALSAELARLSVERTELASRAASAGQAAVSAAAEREQLEAQLAWLRAERTDLSNALSAAHTDTRAAKAAAARLTDERNEAVAKLGVLTEMQTAQAAAKEAECAALRCEREALAHAVERLAGERDDALNRQADESQAAATTAGAAARAEAQLVYLRGERDELEQRLQQAHAAKEEAEHNAARAMAARDDANALANRYSKAATEAHSARIEREELERQLMQAVAERRAAEAAAEVLRLKEAQTTGQHALLQQSMAAKSELSSQLVMLRRECQELRVQAAAAMEAEAMARAEAAAAAARSDALVPSVDPDSQTARLAQKLDTLQAEWMSERKRLMGETAKLSERVLEVGHARDELAARLAEAETKAAYSAAEKGFAVEREALQGKVAVAEAAAQVAKAEAATAKAEAEAEVEALRSRLAAADAGATAAAAEVEALSSQLRAAQVAAQGPTAAQEAEEKERKHLQARLAAITSQLTAASGMATTAIAERDELRLQLSELRATTQSAASLAAAEKERLLMQLEAGAVAAEDDKRRLQQQLQEGRLSAATSQLTTAGAMSAEAAAQRDEARLALVELRATTTAAAELAAAEKDRLQAQTMEQQRRVAQVEHMLQAEKAAKERALYEASVSAAATMTLTTERDLLAQQLAALTEAQTSAWVERSAEKDLEDEAVAAAEARASEAEARASEAEAARAATEAAAAAERTNLEAKQASAARQVETLTEERNMLATRVQQLKQRLTAMGRQATGSLAGSVTSDVAYGSDSDGGGANTRAAHRRPKDTPSENDMIVMLMTERDAAAAALEASQVAKADLERQVTELQSALRDEILDELQEENNRLKAALAKAKARPGVKVENADEAMLQVLEARQARISELEEALSMLQGSTQELAAELAEDMAADMMEKSAKQLADMTSELETAAQQNASLRQLLQMQKASLAEARAEVEVCARS
jgi:chromosome segregation ATPase